VISFFLFFITFSILSIFGTLDDLLSSVVLVSKNDFFGVKDDFFGVKDDFFGVKDDFFFEVVY
jgi:hypothetical protein